jgi:hypothetical protein
MAVNLRVRRDPVTGEQAVTADPVPPVREELRAWIEAGPVEVSGDRLLE